MSSSIRRRLRSAEDDFLSALINGTVALEDFLATWSALHDTIQAEVGVLDQETLSLAYNISSRVSIMAEGFCQAGLSSENLRLQLMQQVEHTLASLSLDDPQTSPHTPNIDAPHSSPCPSYLASAYSWLIRNLHDPYPSTSVKNIITHSSHTSTKSISDWFQKARRRIGWTAISAKYFAGDRKKTVDAAYRALVEEDSERPLDHAVAFDFIEMKVKADGMYATKFRKGELAGSLDLVVKELATGERSSRDLDEAVLAGRKRGRGGNLGSRKRQRTDAASVSAVPTHSPPSTTPELSPSPSSASSLPSDTEDGDVLATSTSGHAHRTSSEHSRSSSSDLSDGAFEAFFDTHDRPSKRSRIHISTDVACPPVAIANSDISFDHWSTLTDVIPADSTIAPASRTSRKRRLSDVGDGQRPKRPRDSLSMPRVCQSVSAPLPISAVPDAPTQPEFDFSEWFTVPSEVTSGGLDASVPLDIELCNWPAFSDLDCGSFATDMSTLLRPSLEPGLSSPALSPDTVFPQFNLAFATPQSGGIPHCGSQASFQPETISDASELRQFLDALNMAPAAVIEPPTVPFVHHHHTPQVADLSMLYFPPPTQPILSPIDILARAGAPEVQSVSKEARLAELVREVEELRDELGVIA